MSGALIAIAVVLWFALPAPLCMEIAHRKGHPSSSAFVWGLLFGWLAVLVYASKTNKLKDAEEQATSLAEAMKGQGPTPGRDERAEPTTNDDDTKCCPDCAESVKAAALVCRFCGHKFTAEETEKALEESRAVLRERLLRALYDADWQVRISAVNRLRADGDPGVCQRLFEAMADAVQKAHARKVDRLYDEIQQGTRRFSSAVINALLSFQDAGIPYLVKSLEDSTTAGLLVKMGAPAADLLEKAIPGSEGKVRKRIERAVADIRRERTPRQLFSGNL